MKLQSKPKPKPTVTVSRRELENKHDSNVVTIPTLMKLPTPTNRLLDLNMNPINFGDRVVFFRRTGEVFAAQVVFKDGVTTIDPNTALNMRNRLNWGKAHNFTDTTDFWTGLDRQPLFEGSLIKYRSSSIHDIAERFSKEEYAYYDIESKINEKILRGNFHDDMVIKCFLEINFPGMDNIYVKVEPMF